MATILEVFELEMAWIGVVEDNSFNVRNVASTGFEDGYLYDIQVTWDETEYGRGPTGEAIKTLRPVFQNNLESNPEYEVWREEALERGYKSSAAIPLFKPDGNRLGALNLYSRDPEFFDNDTVLELMVLVNHGIVSGISSLFIDELVQKRIKERQLHKTLSTITDVNQLMVMEEDRDNLIRGIVTRLQENDENIYTYILVLDDDLNFSKIYSDKSGVEEKFLQVIKAGGLPECIEEALEGDVVQIINDPASGCHECPLGSSGLSNVLIIRIGYREKVYGFLCIYITDGGLTLKDIGLYEEVAMDLGYALNKLEMIQELSASEGRLRNIFSASPDAITTTDIDGVITDCNNATLEIHGYDSKDEVIGRSAFEFMAPGERERAEKSFKELLDQGISRNVEYMFLRKDGSLFPVELSASVVRSSEGMPSEIIVITQDISLRKQAEEKLREYTGHLEQLVNERTSELQEAYDDLKELDRLKDEFIYTITHELRNPLTSIKGYVDYIQDGAVGDIPEEVAGLLEIVQRNTARLQGLTDDLLDQQRIEAGKLTIHKETAPIEEVILEVIEEYEPVLVEKDQKLELCIPETMDPLYFDRDRVSQVLLNLLSNASKYSPEESIITLRVSDEEDSVAVSVIDEGLGLSIDDISILFKPFSRVDKPEYSEASGTGLGLSISKGIIDAHDGKLWAESEGRGKGSTFTFTLPK